MSAVAVPTRGRSSVVGLALRPVRALGLNGLLGFVAVLWLVPGLGLLLSSLLSLQTLQRGGWWRAFTHPSDLTLQNYRDLLSSDTFHFLSALQTTVEIAIGATIIPLLVASMASFALVFLRFPLRNVIFAILVALLVVPLQMAFIPLFSLYSQLHLYDTTIGLVLFHSAFGLPFAIFLLRNFFEEVPLELVEAARVDGVGELRLFGQIILPLAMPAIASLAIFQFLFVWNDLLVALIMARQTQPLTVAIQSQLRSFSDNLDILAPAAFLSLLVPLVVFFAFQRHFVRGLLAGSVK